MPNLFEAIYVDGYDQNYIQRGKMILHPYQVVPQFYMKYVDKLILHYAMGTGKTASSINVVADIIRNIFELRKLNFKLKQKVFYIGNWSIQEAVFRDIKNDVFRIVDKQRYNEIKKDIEEGTGIVKENAIKANDEIDSGLLHALKFHNYTAFFTLLFGKNASQNITVDELIKKQLPVNQKVLDQLKNSVIVVDEMQKLYSIKGINTYGYSIMRLLDYQKEYNFKIVLLTGTMINTTITELAYIANILHLSDNYLNVETLFDTIETDGIQIPKFKPGVHDMLIKLFKDYIMYYDPSLTENDLGTIKGDMRVYKPVKGKPEARFRGTTHNRVISLADIEMHGYQAKEYKEYLKGNIGLHQVGDDDDLHVHLLDAAIPPENELAQHNIVKEMNSGLFKGKFLDKANIGNYSCLGEYMLKHVSEVSKRKEKIAIYHDKLRNFGLLQYAAILEYNGWCRYETYPVHNTLCYHCHEERSRHNDSTDHEFKPLTFAILSGDQPQSVRSKILATYNAPNNAMGSEISAIFISPVAHVGISLLNTNHLLILSRIANIPIWKQIYNRINRLNSHVLLPPDKQWTETITCAPRISEEPKISRVNRYYLQREYYNGDIEKYSLDLSHECISNILIDKKGVGFNYEQRGMTKEIADEIYKSNAIELGTFVALACLEDSYPWAIDKLIKRIKDTTRSIISFNLSYISDTELKDFLTIQGIRLVIVGNTEVAIPRIKDIKSLKPIYPRHTLSTLSFNVFTKNQDTLKSSILEKLMDELVERNKAQTTCLKVISRIFDLVKDDWSILSSYEIFWRTIFIISDEYYNGDEDRKNFIRNHSVENRERIIAAVSEKGSIKDHIQGFYYGDKVIMVDGSSKYIERTTISELQDLNGIYYTITPGSNINAAQWCLQVKVINSADDDITDKRRKSRGRNIISLDKNDPLTIKIRQYFSIPDAIHHQAFSLYMLSFMCTQQVQREGEGDILTTPFENFIQ